MGQPGSWLHQAQARPMPTAPGSAMGYPQKPGGMRPPPMQPMPMPGGGLPPPMPMTQQRQPMAQGMGQDPRLARAFAMGGM
jgi:hypothetical protein